MITAERKQVNLYNFGWIKWGMREGTTRCLLREAGDIWAVYNAAPLAVWFGNLQSIQSPWNKSEGLF